MGQLFWISEALVGVSVLLDSEGGFELHYKVFPLWHNSAKGNIFSKIKNHHRSGLAAITRCSRKYLHTYNTYIQFFLSHAQIFKYFQVAFSCFL